jgi:serine/threonine protein kinase
MRPVRNVTPAPLSPAAVSLLPKQGAKDRTSGSFVDSLRQYAEVSGSFFGLFCQRRQQPTYEPGLPETRQELSRLGVQMHKYIGRGAHSKVYQCSIQGHEDMVAMKIFMSDVDATREIKILQELQHPNIVRMVKVISTQPLYIAYQLCKGGTLGWLLHDPHNAEDVSKKLKYKQRLGLMISVAGAVAFLHQRSVMHRDVKPDNVFLTQPVKMGQDRLVLPPVVLGDFGYARTIPNHSPAPLSRLGTLRYIAPEVLMGAAYMESADVFSMGVFLHELITGQIPYSEHVLPERALAESILDGLRPSLDHMTGVESDRALINFLTTAWHPDPEQRLPALDMHSWLQTLAV